MELVERKELLEKLLKEAISQIDCFIYQPLTDFIDLPSNIVGFDDTVRFLQRNMRKYLVKMHLNMVSTKLVCVLVYVCVYVIVIL